MTIFAGQILKNLRKAKRYSQQFLADQLIVSRPTYERYESGTVEIPLSKLCAVARLYQIESLELIHLVLTTNSLPSHLKRSTIDPLSLFRKDLYR